MVWETGREAVSRADPKSLRSARRKPNRLARVICLRMTCAPERGDPALRLLLFPAPNLRPLRVSDDTHVLHDLLQLDSDGVRLISRGPGRQGTARLPLLPQPRVPLTPHRGRLLRRGQISGPFPAHLRAHLCYHDSLPGFCLSPVCPAPSISNATSSQRPLVTAGDRAVSQGCHTRTSKGRG